MAFHPKQITQFLSSRVGIIIIVFLVGGFALAFYSFSNKQAAAAKTEDSHRLEKMDVPPPDATPASQSQNDNTVSDVDANPDERTYDRPPAVVLPDLPPPPPPPARSPTGTSGVYNSLKPPPPTPPPPPLMVAHYGGGEPAETTPAPAPPAGGSPAPGHPALEGPPGEYTGDFAPFGRLLKCELVNTIDSSDAQTPIIAFVTDDLWWNGKLIIPAGTEVHGLTKGGTGSQDTSVAGPGGKATPQNPSSGGTLRDRLTVEGDWIFVMPPYEEAPNGAELSLNAEALDRENLTANDDGSWGITDGSYGIKGNIIDDRSNDRIIEFLGDFIAGALPTLESSEVTSVPVLYNNNSNGGSNSNNSQTVYTTPRATLANGALQGFSTAVNQQVQNIENEIQRDGYYIRVPAGRQFYLYIEQTIDPTDAHIGQNFKSHTTVGAIKKISPPNLFNSFMKSLGKPQSNIVSPEAAAEEAKRQQDYANSLNSQVTNERTTEESQLQTLMDQQDAFLKIVSKTQLSKNADQAMNMAPPTPPPSNP